MEARVAAPINTSMGIQISLAINGTTNKFLRKSGIEDGDVLLLSRPLGTGILFAGAMNGETRAKELDQVLRKMTKSQHRLVQDLISLEGSIHACTDITGFGLLGHLGEMLEYQPDLTVQLDGDAIPIYEGTIRLIKAGVASTIAPSNRKAWRWLDKTVQLTGNRYESMLELLVDPQTCGPLLVACDKETGRQLSEKESWTLIGAATKNVVNTQRRANTKSEDKKKETAAQIARTRQKSGRGKSKPS